MTGFQIGELILVSKPYAYVLSNQFRGKRCDSCLKTQENLKRCSQCSFLYFCDKTCQARIWHMHKEECKFIMKAKPNEPSAAMRLISLIIFKIKKHGQNSPVEDVNGRKVSFQTLMSHSNEISHCLKTCQMMTALKNNLNVYIGPENVPDMPAFIEIYGKMCINSFNICDGEMRSIGCGIYLGASVFDHSCEPNAEAVFDGTDLIIRATQKIPQKDLNKVYISYIEQLQLTKERTTALEEQYYFSCQCDRCISFKYDDSMTSLLIPEAEANGLLTKLTARFEFLKQMKKDNAGPSTLYSACLEELSIQDKILSDTHICRVKFLEIAFDACIESNQWADALIIGRQLIKPYRLYYGPYHPTLGIHLFKIGKIENFQNISTSSETLQQAEEVLKVTHGEPHPLYQDLQHQIILSKLGNSFPSEKLEIQ